MIVEPAESTISDRAYTRLRTLLQRHAGIALADNKKPLVCGRLQRRVTQLGLGNVDRYLQHIDQPEHGDERDLAIDLLTTNETYFWREPAHFELLADAAHEAQAAGRVLRVWSAACSSGEEPYSIAMVLQQLVDGGLRLRWELHASDLSERMLARCARGHYPLERARQLPQTLLRRYCLRGTGAQEGTLLVQPALRERVCFHRINLIEPLPDLGNFDVIFLRNVLIYFDPPTKRQVVGALRRQLRAGGLFCVGMAESLGATMPGLSPYAPGAYRATAAP